jgi:LCP family protein required for cell wall assembly
MTKRKKNKTINKISKIIFIMFLFISLLTLGIVLYLQILPTKYITAILIIYLISIIILGLILSNKKVGNKKKIIVNILCTLLMILFGFILYYLNITMNFMSKIKSDNYQMENYYIVVLKDSNYQQVSDLQGQTIGIYLNQTDTIEIALTRLDEKLQTNNITQKEYSDILYLANNLLNSKIAAIFISDSYLTLISEQIDNFEDNIRIIDTITVKIENKTSTKDVDVTKEPFNVYISGIDVAGSISSVSRSDVNMIMTVNPNTHQILLTSIPRDYYVRLHGTTGYKDKLTHSGLYGINMTIETVEDLLDIEINYYIRVNFTTLINVVDAIDGIDVYSDYTFTSMHGNYNFTKGLNHMNGDQALGFSRERYAFESGDRQRVKNQQAVLTGIINKISSSSTLLTKYTSILSTLSDSFETNMSSNRIYSLINMQLDQMPSWNIESISLNGTDSSNYTYSYSAGKLYVMEPDESTITSAVEKINQIEGK